MADCETVDPTRLFINELPFEMFITGTLNGEPFTVEGKGLGNSNKGYINGKWTCTSGKCLAWPAMGPTLGYGFKAFASYPNAITQFFQQCMPEGYTQERTITFENDGTLTAHHDISLHNGVVRNIVKFEGVGFNPDGPLMNDGIKTMLNSTERVLPNGKGIKCASVHFYPLKDGSGHVKANCITYHRCLSETKNVPIPGPHFTRSQQKHMIDADDDSNHVVQHEVIQGHDFELMK